MGFHFGRSCLGLDMDAEGAWSEREHKLIIDRFEFFRVRKMIGNYKAEQKRIWPCLRLLDDGFQIILVPDYRKNDRFYRKRRLDGL